VGSNHHRLAAGSPKEVTAPFATDRIMSFTYAQDYGNRRTPAGN
jgi:hypothetical protein